MRVLLVRPPVPARTIGLKHLMVCEPLELEYVAAGLSPEHDVQILDLLLEHGLERRLRQFRPDVVGTSCYITGVDEATRVCRTARRWDPGVRTIVGGVHAARVPEDFVDPAVDIIVQGDGTTLLPQLLRTLAAGGSPLDVSHVAVPDGRGGLRLSPRAPYLEDPDALPFPRRDLTAHLRHRYFYLYHAPLALLKTAWGCWYRCNFCFNWQVTGGGTHLRSPESIVAELESIREPEVYIVDDIFLASRRRLQRTAELLRLHGIRKHYLCFGRADFIAANEDLIAEWAELGLSGVLVGLEAATDQELRSMEKRTTVDVNRQAVAVLRRNGVDPYGSLIPRPDYTPADWARLQRFIDETGLYYLNISPLTPLPGTLIWPEYRDRITVRREAHALWDLSHVVLPTRMPLRAYYRSLLRLYAHSIVNLKRAARVTVRPRPPLLSRASLRIWWGVLRVALQLRRAHRHHDARSTVEPRAAEPIAPPADPARAAFTGVKAFRRIQEVDQATWDALVPPDELQMRHAFVRACQDADIGSAEYRHLLVYRDGALAGIASIFRMDVRLELLCPGVLRSVARAVRRVYPSFLEPTLLLCGLPVSAGRPCIAFRSAEDANFVVDSVAEFMESVAKPMRARVLGFKEFDPAQAAALDGLRDHGYFRAHSLPALRMELPWRDLEEYVASMRSGYRRQLRATLRAGGEGGLRCRVSTDPLSDCARFFPLYEQVMDRARFQLERLNLPFFANVLLSFPDCSRLLLLERGDALLAAAVVLESAGLTTFFMTGLDYATEREWQVYENLVTAVVADAIAAGRPRLQLGQTSNELKARLGGVPEERWIFLRCRSGWAHALLRRAAPLLFPPTRLRPRHVFSTAAAPPAAPRPARGKASPDGLAQPAAATHAG